MAIYLIKDQHNGAVIRRTPFSRDEIERARRFIEETKDFTTRDSGEHYEGPNRQIIGLGRDQVQLQEVEPSVLRGLIRVLQPKYYLSDSAEGKFSVSELPETRR